MFAAVGTLQGGFGCSCPYLLLFAGGQSDAVRVASIDLSVMQHGVRVQPSEGVFYVLCLKRTWRVHVMRHEVDGAAWDHAEFWQRMVAPMLAKVHGLDPRAKEELALHPYGFPRGRVTLTKAGWRIYHGGDFDRLVARTDVEGEFGLAGIAKWSRDDHERCLAFDREGVCRLLGLRATWPALDE